VAAAVKPAAAPERAPAPAAEEADRELARIEVRTDPPNARLTVDHHEVRNPYLLKAPRSHRLHDVVATSPGMGEVRETIAFDRDRELVLKLGSQAAPARSDTTAAPPATNAPSPPNGYRGSKLKIETEFP
jgi:hypothetical protein